MNKQASTNPSDLQLAIKNARQTFIGVGVFSFFINLLMLVPPLYMLQLYDRALTSRSEETLLMLTLVVVLLFMTMGALEFIRSRVLVRLGNRLDGQLNDRLFDAMFANATKNPGKGTAQPIQDLTSVRQFMTGNGLFAFFDAPWLPIFIFVLFLFHPWFGWFAIFAAIVLFSIALVNEFSTAKLLASANQKSIQSNQFMSSNLRNSEVVHAMGMENAIRKNWLSRHLSFLEDQSQASDKASIWTNLSKNLRLMFQSLILGLGAYLAIIDEVTPGMMIAGSIILGRALAPLDLLINSWKGFSAARSSYGRLNELLTMFPAGDRSMSLPQPKGDLSVQNVLVVPPGSQQPSVRGVSFDLPAGHILGVIGPSAAGKSSLARALLGVWPAVNGKVRIDGADLAQWNRDELGSHLGYLPQDIELFDGTIAENIARFGEVDADKVVQAAQMAGVHEMVLQLPNGYDTVIGQNSGGLSGGQRQRIGLARALYDNPRLVVLDEPNSNLDEQGENALLNAIDQLKAQGSSVVVISHKPNVLSHVDLILVLKAGQAQMMGPRDEVLAKFTKPKGA